MPKMAEWTCVNCGRAGSCYTTDKSFLDLIVVIYEWHLKNSPRCEADIWIGKQGEAKKRLKDL